MDFWQNSAAARFGSGWRLESQSFGTNRASSVGLTQVRPSRHYRVGRRLDPHNITSPRLDHHVSLSCVGPSLCRVGPGFHAARVTRSKRPTFRLESLASRRIPARVGLAVRLWRWWQSQDRHDDDDENTIIRIRSRRTGPRLCRSRLFPARLLSSSPRARERWIAVSHCRLLLCQGTDQAAADHEQSVLSLVAEG